MKYANDYSSWGNEVLYEMCRKRPLHDDIDTISSKLWIIGRSYSAAIERQAGKDFKRKDAAKILKSSKIDKYISDIKKIKRPNSENMWRVVEAHRYLTALFKKATSKEKRSLASKYLHFHSPKSVFIFDSIANREIRRILNSEQMRFPITNKYDNQYEGFYLRCLYYRDHIFEKELNAKATPRRLDMELIKYEVNYK